MKLPPLEGEQRWILVWAPDLSDLLRCVLQGNQQGAIDAAERVTSTLPDNTRIRNEVVENIQSNRFE